ncbi:MAG: hypothetical protein GY866_19390, partial [Proteobacteria bacterium]|nr:hypothetical protein [Pseudomonadota bacterium]
KIKDYLENKNDNHFKTDTLFFGIDYYEFIIDWFEKYRKRLKRREET